MSDFDVYNQAYHYRRAHQAFAFFGNFKMNLRLITSSLLVTLCACSASFQTPIPDGWREPTKADLTGDWEQTPEAISAKGDFDGDGVEDEAKILLKTTDSKVGGLFVLLGSGSNVFLSEIPYPRSMGVASVSSGEYDTSCGKGGPCEPSDPKKITVTTAAISFFKFESASSLFVWNKGKKEFVRVWMSD